MKKITLLLVLCFCITLQAQVSITNSSSTLTPSGVFDLSLQTKPIIVSNTDSAPSDAVDGTIIFNDTTKKIEYKNDTGWQELTLNAGVKNTPIANLGVTPEPSGVIIGGGASSAPGVLVLDSTDKGFVLPRVDSPQDISLPTSGSIIYDGSKKMVAFYNGTEWSFWEVPLTIGVAPATVTVGTPINQDVTITYTGGKEIAYPAGNKTTDGITITYPAGTFGASGTITAHLSGTPTNPGTVIFTINEGTQPFDIVTITVNN